MHLPFHPVDSETKRSLVSAGVRSGSFTWAVTFLLLALVSAIYAFGGTDGEWGSLYGRIAAMGFAVLALMIFFIRRTP